MILLRIYCNKWQIRNVDEQQFVQLINWYQYRFIYRLHNYREVWCNFNQFTRDKRFLVVCTVVSFFDNFVDNLQVVSIRNCCFLIFQVIEQMVLHCLTWVFSCFENSNLRCWFQILNFHKQSFENLAVLAYLC